MMVCKPGMSFAEFVARVGNERSSKRAIVGEVEENAGREGKNGTVRIV